jgi:hypothetical protein
MSERSGSHNLWRSVGAVVAGLLTVIILSLGTDQVMHSSGIYPPWGEAMADSLFLSATAYRVIYGIVGAYVAARLAPLGRRPMRCAMIVGVIGLLLSIVGVAATRNAGPEFGPRWSPLALAVTSIPCAWLGGRICEAKLRAEVE